MILISVNNELVGQVKYPEDQNFTFGNNTVQVIFKNTTATSIKEFTKPNQGNFLNIIL